MGKSREYKMNIYLFGGDSYIAKEFYQKTSQKDKCKIVSRELVEKDYSFDLLNPESFNFSIINNNDIILFFAANSSPDSCEKDFQSAYQTNVIWTSYFIRKFLEQNAKVLFLSSDGVFNGGEDTFYEDSPRNPISKYGEMKLSIEKEFEKNKNVKIFRLSHVYSRKDKFSSYLEKCVKEKCEVEVYPMFRSTVYIDDLIEGIDNVTRNWDSWDNQIFNICGEEMISREEIARYFKEIVSDLEIKIVEPEESFFKARPKIIKMKSNFFPALLGRPPTKLKEAMLREYNK
ncbi:MAG: sugar nucleotide-binding protein [Nanoarchaeota archaeon]